MTRYNVVTRGIKLEKMESVSIPTAQTGDVGAVTLLDVAEQLAVGTTFTTVASKAVSAGVTGHLMGFGFYLTGAGQARIYDVTNSAVLYGPWNVGDLGRFFYSFTLPSNKTIDAGVTVAVQIKADAGTVDTAAWISAWEA